MTRLRKFIKKQKSAIKRLRKIIIKLNKKFKNRNNYWLNLKLLIDLKTLKALERVEKKKM
jgi:plasmid maintenance system antidote protein VapI